MTRPLRRRWFVFSLRTLFGGVTVVACWLGYQLNWIRERHEFFKRGAGADCIWSPPSQSIPSAPVTRALLRLFGEPAKDRVWVTYGMWTADESNPEAAHRLFPEAIIRTAVNY